MDTQNVLVVTRRDLPLEWRYTPADRVCLEMLNLQIAAEAQAADVVLFETPAKTTVLKSRDGMDA